MNIISLTYSLIVVGYLVAITGIFKDSISADHKKAFRITVFTILTISSAAQFFTERLKNRKAWTSITSGRLVSKVSSAASVPVIKLGVAPIHWHGSPDRPAIIMGEAGDAAFLRLVNGEAKITVSVRDSKGAVLATVRDNEWFVGTLGGNGDRNFNQDTLEVLGDDGKPVLQIHVKGENAELALKTYSPFGGAPISMGPWISESNGSGPTLFKYPSVKYQGELAVAR